MVYSVAWSPDGHQTTECCNLFSAGFDNKVIGWKVAFWTAAVVGYVASHSLMHWKSVLLASLFVIVQYSPNLVLCVILTLLFYHVKWNYQPCHIITLTRVMLLAPPYIRIQLGETVMYTNCEGLCRKCKWEIIEPETGVVGNESICACTVNSPWAHNPIWWGFLFKHKVIVR